MLDLRYVKKLVEMLDESSLDSIEISTEKGLRIRVSKAVAPYAAMAPQQAATVMVQAPSAAEMQQLQQLRLSPAGGIPVPADPELVPAPTASLVDVKSPMVGTFYAAAEPGAKPFATVGTRVAKGQVVCIIEAMKIMNEIESDHAGVVKEVLASDAHPVEFGQVMFRIDPNG